LGNLPTKIHGNLKSYAAFWAGVTGQEQARAGIAQVKNKPKQAQKGFKLMRF